MDIKNDSNIIYVPAITVFPENASNGAEITAKATGDGGSILPRNGSPHGILATTLPTLVFPTKKMQQDFGWQI
jgi:hypothetical protein